MYLYDILLILKYFMQIIYFFEKYKTPLILFLEGMVSVSLQFLFMRALLPFVGSSVGTSSIIICTFLMALALGYHFGGSLLTNFKEKLLKNFFLASIFASIGLSPLITETYFNLIGYQANLLLAVSTYAIIFMAPSVFWLGQTMPLLANLIESDSKGKVSGTVLFFSTTGNVIGSLLTVLLLMYYFGFAFSVFLNIALLLLLIFFIEKNKKIALIKISFVGFFAWFILIQSEKIFYDHTNQYANYKIVNEKNGDKRLISNNTDQSKLSANKTGHYYIEEIKKLINKKTISGANVLVLGAGGFTLGHYDHQRKYTYIDIDDQIKDFAEQKFLEEKINGTFVASDARLFLNQNNQLWEVIVLDTFSSRAIIPSHLASIEYFNLVKSRLKKDGWFFINAILEKNFENDFSQQFNNTVLSVFKNCFIIEVDNPDNKSNKTNIIYSCIIKQNNNKIITDKFLNF